MSVCASVAIEVPAPKSSDILVECKIGRLIVTRIGALRSPRQVAQIQFAMGRALQQAGDQAVVCTDWRQIDIFAPPVADAILEMLTVTNNQVLRGGILLNSDKATFNLQVERVLRDAGNPGRQCFRDAERLLNWLAQSLDPPEVQIAQQFLAR